MGVGRLSADTEPDKILRQSLGIDVAHKISLRNICGPFEDEASAVIALSERMGFLQPRATA
jgi:hypothetical protein